MDEPILPGWVCFSEVQLLHTKIPKVPAEFQQILPKISPFPKIFHTNFGREVGPPYGEFFSNLLLVQSNERTLFFTMSFHSKQPLKTFLRH